MLEIRDFSKTYRGGKRAVDHLSLRVEPGSIVGFIGPNGAGKTTTIRAIVGVLDFDEGDIWIGGHSVRREPIECKKLLAYVPDDPNLYEYLTGMQYLNFMADVFGVSAEDREARVREYGALDVRAAYHFPHAICCISSCDLWAVCVIITMWANMAFWPGPPGRKDIRRKSHEDHHLHR